MAEVLISEFVDRTGLIEDKDFMLKTLNEIYTSFQKINAIKLSLNTDSGFKDAIKNVGALRKEQDSLLKQQSDLEAAYRKRMALETENAKLLAEEKLLIQQRNEELKNEVKAQNAANGSIDQARAKLSQLRAERNKVDLTTSGGQATKDSLNKQIDALDDFVKANSDAYTKQKINIGNYSGAVKTLEKALQDVRAKMDDYGKSGKVSADVIASLTKEEGLLANLVNTQVNGFASATAELKNNERALQALAAAGLQSEQFYKDLLAETAELKDNVGDLKAEIKALASDTSTFDGLVQGAQTLVGVYGIAQGAAALFGEENEDLQKTLVKLQAVQTILTGLQGIQNALQKESSLMILLQTVRTKALTLVTRAQTFALSGATTAARAFNTALLAGGITAILLLLPLAISAMESFADSTDDATKSTEELKKEVDELNQKLNEQADASERVRNARDNNLDGLRRELKLLEASGASAGRVSETKQKILDKELYNLEVRRNTIEEDGKIEIDLDREILDKKTDIEAERLSLQKHNAEESKKISDDAAAKAKESAEKQTAIAEKERKAQFEIFKLAQQDKIEALKKETEGDGSSGLRIAARLRQADEEAVLIEAQKKFELKAAGLTASERVLIEKQAEKSIIESAQQAATDIINIRQATNERIKSMMATANEDRKTELAAQAEKEIGGNAAELEKAQRRLDVEADREKARNLSRFQSGAINKEQYEKNKLDIENKYRILSLQSEIDFAEDIFKISNISGDARAEAERKLFELRRQLNAEDVKNTEKTEDEKLAIRQARNEKLKELGNELKETVFAFLTAGIDKEKNEIQANIDALEVKKQKDIEVANQSISSATERAAAISVIEARANAQREQLERRKRQLDTERARYERVKNIADIIQSTAIAVVSALGAKPFTPANIAIAAIVGAIGAAQIARVLATPLPKFAAGKRAGNNYEGLAIVGDGGKHEMILRENGSMELTPKTDTVTWLHRNDIVLPDANKLLQDQFNMAINANGRLVAAYNNQQNPQSNQRESDIRIVGKDIVRAIKSMPQTNIVVESKLRQWVHSNGSQNNYI